MSKTTEVGRDNTTETVKIEKYKAAEKKVEDFIIIVDKFSKGLKPFDEGLRAVPQSDDEVIGQAESKAILLNRILKEYKAVLATITKLGNKSHVIDSPEETALIKKLTEGLKEKDLDLGLHYGEINSLNHHGDFLEKLQEHTKSIIARMLGNITSEPSKSNEASRRDRVKSIINNLTDKTKPTKTDPIKKLRTKIADYTYARNKNQKERTLASIDLQVTEIAGSTHKYSTDFWRELFGLEKLDTKYQK